MSTVPGQVSRIIERIDDYAFQHRAYEADVLAVLRAVAELWAGSHPAAAGPAGAVQIQVAPGLDPGLYPFHAGLQVMLAGLASEVGEEIEPLDLLRRVIEHYERASNPRAYALLASLARQSDVEYSKRRSEQALRDQALWAERLAASGVPLPPHLEDIQGFGHEHFARLAARIPTGQSILDFYILGQLRRRLARVAPVVVEGVRENGIPRNVYFGTLELATPAAEILPVAATDEYLVVLSRGLWTAASLASNLITRCIELHPALLVPVGFTPDGSEELAALSARLDATLRGEAAPPRFTGVDGERRKQFWDLLDHSMKTFIFGHEFSHALLGHLGPARDHGLGAAESWNQEFMADVVALKLSLLDLADEGTARRIAERTRPAGAPDEAVAATARSAHVAMSFQVVAGAILVLYLFWRMEALRGMRSADSGSHPPVQLRIGALWRYCRMFVDGFDRIFPSASGMISSFLQLLAPVEGGWRDRFEEAAFGARSLFSYDAVLDALEKVNTGAQLADSALEPYRARLEALLADPEEDDASKSAVLDRCVAMLRMGRAADPLRSIEAALREGSTAAPPPGPA